MSTRNFLIFCFALPGALQGIALYFMSELRDPESLNLGILSAYIFVLIAPVVHHLSTEPDRRLSALVISGSLASVCAALGAWTYYRYSGGVPMSGEFITLFVFIVISCLSIVLISLPFLRSGFIRKQSIFNYPLLFEHAWGQCVCMLIAFLFTVLAFLVLLLSISLFRIIGVHLSEFFFRPIIMTPLLGAAFGLAIGIARQSDNIVYATRDVLLALLKALLPIFTAITGIFLFMSVVTGINNIDTGFSVTFLLLISMILAVILANGAVQDNTTPLKGFMRWVLRAQAFILLGFSILAFYGLWMRVGEYGFTHGRLIALIITIIVSIYAVGYVFAVLTKSLVLNIQRVNIAAAFISIMLAIALLTPVLDVHRISVHSQVNALLEGRVSPDEFDFKYLKFKSGQAGKDALTKLYSLDTADNDGLASALQRADELSEFQFPGPSEYLSMEEFNELVLQGQLEFYQPLDDTNFEQLLLSDSHFANALRISCSDKISRCVVMQTTEFNSTGFQYLLAQSDPTSSISIKLFYRNVDGNWQTAIDTAAFWDTKMLQVTPETLTQVMDGFASGSIALEPITLQGVRIGENVYIPGIGSGLKVLQER